MVEKIRTTADTSLGDLLQPLFSVGNGVDSLASAWHGPAAVQSFYAGHDAGCILGESEVYANQLPEVPQTAFAVINRGQQSSTEQICQFARIDLVVLVPGL